MVMFYFMFCLEEVGSGLLLVVFIWLVVVCFLYNMVFIWNVVKEKNKKNNGGGRKVGV